MAATQNINDEIIFIWDLYNRRSMKPTDDKTSDQPEIQIGFKNEEAQIRAFSWSHGSCDLNIVTHYGLREETYLFKTNLGMIERKFNMTKEIKDYPKTCLLDTEKTQIQINLLKPDKTIDAIKLPTQVSTFYVNKNVADEVFIMNHGSDMLIDLREKNGITFFGQPASTTSNTTKPENFCHIEHNGDNFVFFGRQNQAYLYDVRNVY